MEKRRGWGRVQAFYGAGIFYQLTRSGEAYSYGNALSASNVNPTTTINFNNGSVAQVSDRVDYIRNSPTHGIGARLFVGVEYFFASRISIGGEFGWGAMGNIAGDSVEGRTRYTTQEEEYTKNGRTTQSFNLDTDNLNGAINLMVYF
ncbi:MAG: hypothetical protein CL840_20350 [Crocinitomicaceae bacterium]|nr:hypothetical protein [Crocinitomicaceae bacterium]